MERRDFVRALAGMFAANYLERSTADSVTIGVVSSRAAFRHGVELGLREASRAAELFRRGGIDVVYAPRADRLVSRGVDALLAVEQNEATAGIAELAKRTQTVFLNCGARADSLRGSGNPYLFHIEGSDTMYRNAAAIAASSRVVLWHPDLERYGAAQLNYRYRNAFRGSMDSVAWAGWFAVKVLWESSLRAEGTPGLRGDVQFDGHKGTGLTFRESDHQLRQPVYAVVKGTPPREIPDLARSSGTSRDLLDSLIDRR